VGAREYRQQLSELARRCGNLSPLAAPVRQVLVDGNRERALAGTDAQGRAFAPVKASTRKTRGGPGPPLAPRGASSRIVTGYVVAVLAGVGRLTFTGSWPGLPWVEYHRTGTKRMPRRDPFGFRRRDLNRVADMLRKHVFRR
jgi:hypothetical protein